MGDSSDEDYKVGFKKPPREHQFAKGTSGNPAGRPRGAKNNPLKHSFNPFVDSVIRAAGEMLPAREGGERIEMTAFDAAMRQIAIKAARGEFRFVKLLVDLRRAAEEERLEEMASQIKTVEAYKAQWDPVFERARISGLPEPKQLPHPDHVNISRETCLIELTGPDTPDLKKEWDELKRALRLTEKMLLEARQHAQVEPKTSVWHEIVKQHSKTFRRLQKNVPPGWNWREEIGDISIDLRLAAG